MARDGRTCLGDEVGFALLVGKLRDEAESLLQ